MKVSIGNKFWALLIIFNSLSPSAFYKAQEFWENPYWGEPILDKDRLSNFVIKLKSGSTKDGLNHSGVETNVLNIYGPTKLSNITKGVPSSVLNKYPTSPINNVWSIDGLSREFGNITFSSKFRSTNLNFYLTQNLAKGLFIGSIFQIENTRFRNIEFTDSTRVTDLPSTITREEWQIFSRNLFKNMEKYGISMPTETSSKGLSRIDVLGGWTRSFTNTEYLDFVDFTATIGASFSTIKNNSAVFNLHQKFEPPNSAIISARTAIGVWNWITAGIVIGTEIYPKYNKEIPMKTDADQSGIVNLATGMAKIDKKPAIRFGFFVKAEQFYKSFSIIFGYQYTNQKRTNVYPNDIFTFNYAVVNSDCALCKWKMHTINFSIDYDFATEKCPSLPRVGAFFDFPVDGIGIFKTKQSGLGISIKTEW